MWTSNSKLVNILKSKYNWISYFRNDTCAILLLWQMCRFWNNINLWSPVHSFFTWPFAYCGLSLVSTCILISHITPTIYLNWPNKKIMSCAKFSGQDWKMFPSIWTLPCVSVVSDVTHPIHSKSDSLLCGIWCRSVVTLGICFSSCEIKMVFHLQMLSDSALMRFLSAAIKGKLGGVLSSGIVLLYDNARLHVSHETAALLRVFR